MPEDSKYRFLNQELKKQKQAGRLRELTAVRPGSDSVTIEQEGSTYINFSSNDYLGLTHHPEVSSRAGQYLKSHGTGSAASRLITGSYDIHMQLERAIARTFDREAALLLNSGFQANSSLLGTLTDRHSLILADKLSHSSLLQGALASRADFKRFNHNDTEHLESLLEDAENSYNRIWIVTETVFSMDGDRSPIEDIAALAAKYNALLFADDAHAVGVWGPDGLGLAKDVSGVDILLGTCGKAFGSFGAYVACSQKMKQYLVNFCPGFIYTTALPPAVIGSIAAALKLIPTLNEQRKKYHHTIDEIRNQVSAMGFDTGPSATQIIPLIVGKSARALSLANSLKRHGILATAIRPPTVPEDSSRIRLTISSDHTEKHIQTLFDALKAWNHE